MAYLNIKYRNEGKLFHRFKKYFQYLATAWPIISKPFQRLAIPWSRSAHTGLVGSKHIKKAHYLSRFRFKSWETTSYVVLGNLNLLFRTIIPTNTIVK